MKILMSLCLVILTYSLPGQSLTNYSDSSRSFANKRVSFIPTFYYRKFSSQTAPVLKILPGDTIYTETVDAGGYDKDGVKRTERGNPLTGPFFIEGAKEGDVLVISFLKVFLNRNYATTVEGFVSRSLPKDIIKQMGKNAKLVKWNLDQEKGIATPMTVHEHLQNFQVPLSPFLGCVGVAPPGGKEIMSYDSGPFGGNLDFKSLKQSASIYLPVFAEGALLFLGDGHAVQGDGELTGDALETSMSIEFSVQIIKKEILQLDFPRVEDSVYIMSIGLDKSLDNALKLATAGLLTWLQKEYQLSLQEATQVIGTSIEYTIAEIADPKVEVVAKIKKSTLKGLKKFN
jgi:amidase